MNTINTEKFIYEWDEIKSEQSEFNSLFDYALYTCGGDFNLFDNYPLLEENFTK